MADMRRSDTRLRVGTRPVEGQPDAGQSTVGAMRFAAAIATAAVGFLIVAALWVSTCTEAIGLDTAACGVPQRTALGLGAPLILFAGAAFAFVSTYRAWRSGDEVWSWQGAGWFLSTVMLVTLAMGFPAIAGPAFGG